MIKHDYKIKKQDQTKCQSPLRCNNVASQWNERERKYLCPHCTEMLRDIQAMISRC